MIVLYCIIAFVAIAILVGALVGSLAGLVMMLWKPLLVLVGIVLIVKLINQIGRKKS